MERLPNDTGWSELSEREIARRCGVHHEMVGRLKADLSGGNRQIAPRLVSRGGTTHELDVARIGKAARLAPAAPPGRAAAHPNPRCV